jgi:UDP-N-acetylglucosamine transferase subunit ALG13
MRGKTCVLTVGSTRFDPLVHAFLSADSLASLAALGITTVVAQVGNSTLPKGYKEGSTTLPQGLELHVLRFATDLEEQVGQADLVVSHAGTQSIARTPCLDRSAEPARSLSCYLSLAYRRWLDPLLFATSRQLCQSRHSPGL